MTVDISEERILEVKDLKVHFPIKGGIFKKQIGSIRAVDGVSFDIRKGETLGLVGESGCGKSTTGLSVLRLINATSGQINFQGRDLLKVQDKEMRGLRRNMQMVFQDPYSSLNPRMTAGNIIIEPLNVHQIGTKAERHERTKELMQLVGINPSYINRYPHEFSGGQRQRIGLARALSTNPQLIVADEPISALDVSIQAQVVNLMADLRASLGLTYLMVSHDLSMVRYMSDRVAVMYAGEIVEIGQTDDLFDRPMHPYTNALLSAIPKPDPVLERTRKRIMLQGDPPNPANHPIGCRFAARCWRATEVCRESAPVLRNPIESDFQERATHLVACHHV